VDDIPEKKLPVVLLVEDEPTSQAIVCKLLKKVGIEPILASSGEDALEALEVATIDLVLMDINLTGISGIEVTKIIREKEKNTHKHLLIIALTGMTSPGDRELCILAGADGYIPKPVRGDKLLGILDKLFKIKSAPKISDESA